MERPPSAQAPAARGPLVEAIDVLARTSSLRQVLTAAELKAYSRAKQEGTLTLDAVDRLCDGPLQCSAYELYGEAYDRAVLGEGDHAQVTWLDDFRDRARREGVVLELEPPGQQPRWFPPSISATGATSARRSALPTSWSTTWPWSWTPAGTVRACLTSSVPPPCRSWIPTLILTSTMRSAVRRRPQHASRDHCQPFHWTHRRPASRRGAPLPSRRHNRPSSHPWTRAHAPATTSG